MPRCNSRYVLQQQRRAQSNNDNGNSVVDKNKPLFLWIDPMAGVFNDQSSSPSTSAAHHQSLPLLVPESRPKVPNVTTPEDALRLVHEHYSLEYVSQQSQQQQQQQFVGGMGENDAGVAFGAISNSSVDILQHQFTFLQETMELIRQERHGIPFTIYTTGLLKLTDDMPPLVELGVDVIQVSLLAGTPSDYIQAITNTSTNIPPQQLLKPSDFGQVCGFVAQVIEEQAAAVEVGVLAPYAGSGRSLALALGAQHVHVYEKVEW